MFSPFSNRFTRSLHKRSTRASLTTAQSTIGKCTNSRPSGFVPPGQDAESTSSNSWTAS